MPVSKVQKQLPYYVLYILYFYRISTICSNFAGSTLDSFNDKQTQSLRQPFVQCAYSDCFFSLLSSKNLISFRTSSSLNVGWEELLPALDSMCSATASKVLVLQPIKLQNLLQCIARVVIVRGRAFELVVVIENVEK